MWTTIAKDKDDGPKTCQRNFKFNGWSSIEDGKTLSGVTLSTLQIRNWSIVQILPCWRTRNIQTAFPYLCVCFAKRMSLRSGGVVCKLPQVLMQYAASSRYVSQPRHRFSKIVYFLNRIRFMLFFFVIKFFKHLNTRLWIFASTLNKPQYWWKMKTCWN